MPACSSFPASSVIITLLNNQKPSFALTDKGRLLIIITGGLTLKLEERTKSTLFVDSATDTQSINIHDKLW